MKHYLLALSTAILTLSAWANDEVARPCYALAPQADRTLSFSVDDEGESLPILWGLDTAWPSRDNMVRGVRFMGQDAISLARVSFQPWDVVTTPGYLPQSTQEGRNLLQNLQTRMSYVAEIGKKVDIALNLDGGEPTRWDIYKNQTIPWCDLIDATAAEVERMGYNVVSAAPFNEPDLAGNNTSLMEFKYIARKLNDHTLYPRFEHIRLSGPNTLNPDYAAEWYRTLKDYIQEGNTHQLAGTFDNYAAFYETLRADGKWGTNDELHNVMEAMVGAEYGMNEGIWWYTAERARAEFCKASFGRRLAYAENRPAWAAASVYRNPQGQVQAFAGVSERQALENSFRYVSRDRDVYVDGRGPLREFVIDLPGDPTYQGPGQKNAEVVYNISTGDDVQPCINGTYAIMNWASKKVLAGMGGKTDNRTQICQQTYNHAATQQWQVYPTPNTVGCDFSYYFIVSANNGKAMDDLDNSYDVGAQAICWDFAGGRNQQWALEYDRKGWFRIRNLRSALYLTVTGDNPSAENAIVLQQEYADDLSQLWRFVPAEAECETSAPSAPASLRTSALPGAVRLDWAASPEADVAGYDVLRADASGGSFNTIARDVKGTAYLDNTALTGHTYIYKVRANDATTNRSGFSPTANCAPTGAEGLWAGYALNGNLDDASQNVFSLRSAATPQYVEGREGRKALRFDGQQWLQLPYTTCQLPALTLTAWMRADSGNEQPLFSFGGGGKGAFSKEIAAPGSGSLDVSYALPASKWTHIAVAYANGEAKFYVDGELVSERSGFDVTPEDMLLSYIGRGQNTAGGIWQGDMQDLHIYNMALNAAQVGQVMAGQEPESGIETITPDAEVRVASRCFFNLQGQPLSEPLSRGITLERTLLTDGTTSTRKIVR